MLVAATFVLFTALLVSADSSPPLKLVTRSAKITDGGKRMISKSEKVLSNAFRSTKPLEYADCSAEQEKEIASAVKEAQAYASAAHQYLRSNPKGTILYTQWFGTFESAIYDKVIKSASELSKLPSAWRYKCQSSCIDDKHLAWYEPRVFNMCEAFWKVNSNLKAFTILQQGTHSQRVLGSYNLAYGHHNSTQLAAKYPLGAMLNADNHVYFFLAVSDEKMGKKFSKGSKGSKDSKDSRFRFWTKPWFGTRVN